MSNWKYQREFSKNYRCIFIDLAGQGKSTSNRQNYSIEGFARDVVAIINSCDANNCILIGHSMGGAVALETSIMLAKKVSGIIAIDSLFPFPKGFYPKKSDIEIIKFEQTTLANPKEFLFSIYREYIEERPLFSKKDVKELLELRDQTNLKLFGSQLIELMKWNLFEKLKANINPIRCIVSGISVPIASRETYNKFHNSVYIEDVAHFLHIEKPIEFNKRMNEIIIDLKN